MKRYSIIFSKEANKDVQELFLYIISVYKTYRTAEKYVDGIENTILSLRYFAESYLIQTHKSLLRYGNNVRRVYYKIIAIIYTVHGNIVYIHRIIPASMITTL